ncbi:MAG: hypothetical protein AB8G96_12070 [Phycisphaerales bacterium]
MAIATRLHPRFLMQNVAFLLLCLASGLYGVHKYVYTIPKAEAIVARGEVYATVKQAMETIRSEDTSPEVAVAARRTAQEMIAERLSELPEDLAADSEPTKFKPLSDSQWKAELALMGLTVSELPPVAVQAELSEDLGRRVEFILNRVDAAGRVKKPSELDRVVQWVFILCLPFVPWFAWSIWRNLKRGYRLEDDGSLVTADGHWSKDEIAEIDMGRWMEKSIATVVHTDGRRTPLDDFIHRGTDKIVGALAHERMPDKWTPEAKPVKVGTDEADDEAGGPAGDEDAKNGKESDRPRDNGPGESDVDSGGGDSAAADSGAD